MHDVSIILTCFSPCVTTCCNSSTLLGWPDATSCLHFFSSLSPYPAIASKVCLPLLPQLPKSVSFLAPASKVCLPLLQGARGTRLSASAVTIQAAFRGMAIRKELRRVRAAARRIQVTLTQHLLCLSVPVPFFVCTVLLLHSLPSSAFVPS